MDWCLIFSDMEVGVLREKADRDRIKRQAETPDSNDPTVRAHLRAQAEAHRRDQGAVDGD